MFGLAGHTGNSYLFLAQERVNNRGFANVRVPYQPHFDSLFFHQLSVFVKELD